jgi:hypothetical protein
MPDAHAHGTGSVCVQFHDWHDWDLKSLYAQPPQAGASPHCALSCVLGIEEWYDNDSSNDFCIVLTPYSMWET